MGIIIWIIIVTTVTGVFGTGLGGVIACCFRRDSDKTVSLLLSFAAGIMLSVVCFDLITDALDSKTVSGGPNIFLVVAGTLLGYLVIYFMNSIVDQVTTLKSKQVSGSYKAATINSGHSVSYDYNKRRNSKNSRNELYIAGVVMAFAIALHNLPEGIVIGAAYASDTGSKAVSFTGSGLILAVVIGLHDVPEGMAVAVPLISGGMKKFRAVMLTALSGFPTVIGAIIGYSVGIMSPFSLSLALSFASGAMLYVVFGELLPESVYIWRSKYPAFAALIGMLLGMIIIFAG